VSCLEKTTSVSLENQVSKLLSKVEDLERKLSLQKRNLSDASTNTSKAYKSLAGSTNLEAVQGKLKPGPKPKRFRPWGVGSASTVELKSEPAREEKHSPAREKSWRNTRLVRGKVELIPVSEGRLDDPVEPDDPVDLVIPPPPSLPAAKKKKRKKKGKKPLAKPGLPPSSDSEEEFFYSGAPPSETEEQRKVRMAGVHARLAKYEQEDLRSYPSTPAQLRAAGLSKKAAERVAGYLQRTGKPF